MVSFRFPTGLRANLLKTSAVVVLGALSLGACSDDTEAITPVESVGPDLVKLTQANMYPEGIEYDFNNKRFLLSSLTTGTIRQAREDGSIATFATSDKLVSSVGLQIDALRNRLLVAVADPGYNTAKTTAATQGKLAGLATFDNTGRALSYVDLGGLRPAQNHYANDIAVDAQGNVYVTDSFAPIIYRIDAQGLATVFLEDARLGAPAGKFGLNGIEFHPDGYLLVAKSDDGSLFKVPVNNPGGFTKVTSSENLTGIDGIMLQDLNTLYAVANAQSKVLRLTTANGWTNATAAGSFDTPPQFPTTLARRTAAESYVLLSNLNALQTNATPPVSEYSILKLKF